MYTNGFSTSMVDDKDGHIPSPLIMFTCTALHHALLEWQRNLGFLPKATRSKLKADRPNRSNYFYYRNDGGKNASCCAATGCKLLISPGIADMYRFWINTWNELLESYQQRVYKITVAPVKCQIQQMENRTPGVAISMEVGYVEDTILLDYLMSKVPLEEPEIGRTDENIPIDDNCSDAELGFGWPGCSEHYNDRGGKIEESDDIPNTSQRQQATTELEGFTLGTSDINRYQGNDGNDADVNQEDEASQADDGSTQNLAD